MREEGAKLNPPSIIIGEVISPQPTLVIKADGIQLDKEDVLVADYLLKDFTRQIQTTALDPELWSNTSQIKFVESLNAGDKLAIMPTIDKQTYIVICKVVSP
jgi:hypothetical protein